MAEHHPARRVAENGHGSVALDEVRQVVGRDDAPEIQEVGRVARVDVLFRRIIDLGQDDGVAGRRRIIVVVLARNDGQREVGQCGSDLPDLIVNIFVIEGVDFPLV
jgi:hypothetical protein